MEINLIFILTVTFLVFLFFGFLFFFSKIAIIYNLVDYPSDRKIHKGNIPLIGGLSIYSIFFIFFLIFDTNLYHKLIYLTSSLVFFVGLYDDKFNSGILIRIVFQLIACLILVGSEIRIYDLGILYGHTISLGVFGILLTILTMISYINAINFTDGLDGLASGYIINCISSIIIFSLINGNSSNLEPLFFLLLILIFFIFANFGIVFPKCFLGDSGSTFLGFLVSAYLIYFTMPDNRYFHPVLALWAAPLPTFDFLNVFFKRLFLKINPFKPDRRHLHYLLLSVGINNKLTTLIMVSSSFFLSFIGLLIFYYLGAIFSFISFFFLIILFYLFVESTVLKN